ncbi:MAG: CsoR family transcriptional regulator, copper-sensing transcriptional repressor [Candidatus Cloacimonadota bacterium]|nr:CsoR family transcriptional regulator, copper-sensing transcriptional repressor [Candidatus Cloacimonadota bacterium]
MHFRDRHLPSLYTPIGYKEVKMECEVRDVRHAHHSADFKNKLKARLGRIEGQVRGINRMVQEDVYCDDILNQIAAVQSALKSVGKMLLEAHVQSCVVEQIQEGKTEVVKELMRTVSKLMK